MPTTTPNPAELAAAECKRLAALARHYPAFVPYYEQMLAAIDQLRDLASGPSAGAVVDWRVAEFWSSGTPGTKVKLLADDPVQLEYWPKRKDFIRWLSAPAATPPAGDAP